MQFQKYIILIFKLSKNVFHTILCDLNQVENSVFYEAKHTNYSIYETILRKIHDFSDVNIKSRKPPLHFFRYFFENEKACIFFIEEAIH